MADFDEKILWIVLMTDAATEQRLLAHAKAAGATGVCIRTSNKGLPAAIKRFNDEGLDVYAWRWPACRPTTNPANYYAPDQAAFVANTLIPAGLKGYFADIESENDGKANDWDSAQFTQLAKNFCKTIRDAAPAGFVLGLTAGAPQPFNNKHIPWAPFAAASDYVLPQTYWRWTHGTQVSDINGGTPASAVAVGDLRWGPIDQGKPIVPMMGELDVVTTAEINQFGAILVQRGQRIFHAYTDSDKNIAAQLAAIKAL